MTLDQNTLLAFLANSAAGERGAKADTAAREKSRASSCAVSARPEALDAAAALATAAR
jgi:hypothetical protein